MTISNVLAVVTVTDIESARAWYERLLGRPPDRVPMDGCLEWQLTDNGGLQVVRDASRAGSSFVTLGVANLEEHTAALVKRSLEVSAISSGEAKSGETIRIASILDPEGNRITFGEEPGTRPVPRRV